MISVHWVEFYYDKDTYYSYMNTCNYSYICNYTITNITFLSPRNICCLDLWCFLIYLIFSNFFFYF